jgi:hypothetical protein
MNTHYLITLCTTLVVGTLLTAAPVTGADKSTEKIAKAQAVPQKGTTYAPVDLEEDVADVIVRMTAAKPEILNRQMELLDDRYDLANRPANYVTMSRGKPIQEGVRVTLPHGVTWETLEQVHADQLAERIVQLGGEPNLSPEGLLSRNHSEYVEGPFLVEMITEDLIAERIAIDSYREMITYVGTDDPTTRKVLEGILVQEEEHAEDLASLLKELGP